MKCLPILLVLWVAGFCLPTESVQAADEDPFLGQMQPQSGQAMGYGRSAVWTLPLVATQYQPSHPTPAMQAALQSQLEGRFLDAMILLDEAGKRGQASADTAAEMNLLRSSFLLQGNQPRQAIEILAPLLAQTQYASDAYALTAMAYLQMGQMQDALDAVQHAHGLEGGILPHLVLSYVLQGAGRLADARKEIHDFNSQMPQSAVALAREAELALTLDQTLSARLLVDRAHEIDATHPYIISVSGLVYLIDGNALKAKAAFEKALQRDPKDAKALFGLGLAEIKLGNLKAGQAKLLEANEADPGNALILSYLGRLQQQSGQTGDAKVSWRRAQQADPKDPIPWLYQAQAELQDNRPMDARESLRQAQARAAYRSVYRGDRLLKEDEQLLHANFAEIQRKLGLDSLAFQTLDDSVGEKNSANLRNQADVLQGQRFGESARRSLLLQSQFSARPGSLPAELDIYGDGAGQTGSQTPQHGVVSGLSAQQASYNNYDELFNRNATLDVSGTTGNQNTKGEQVLLGVGNEMLGLGIAQRRFKTDGSAPFKNLDNSIWQGVVQWQPIKSTQVFVSRQSFKSHRGETLYPADPFFGGYINIVDNSRITRLGLRHALTDDSELRGVWSHQQTDQMVDYFDFSVPPNYFFSQPGSSSAHSAEMQYRRSGASYAAQWGMQQVSGQTIFRDTSGNISSDFALDAKQFYATWQQRLNPYWQLDAGLVWGKIANKNNAGTSGSTSMARLLPQLGVVYTPDSGTHLRLAAWQGMGIPGLGDASLAPVSIAGILLTRPSDNGKLVHAVALGGDRQLSSAWLLEGEAQHRWTDLPTNISGMQIQYRQQVDESRLAMHWQPQGKPWVVSLAYDNESIQNEMDFPALDSVLEQNLHSQQLTIRWFASTQWTANLTWSHNQVDGKQKSAPDLLAYQDRFNQTDASLSWKFYGPQGELTAGVRNAADVRFQYADTDPLNPRFSNARLVYARLKLGW